MDYHLAGSCTLDRKGCVGSTLLVRRGEGSSAQDYYRDWPRTISTDDDGSAGLELTVNKHGLSALQCGVYVAAGLRQSEQESLLVGNIDWTPFDAERGGRLVCGRDGEKVS